MCSANSDNEVSLDELLAYFGPVGLWLEVQLTPVIGLEKLKSQIRGFYRSVALDQKRIEAGHAISKGGSQYHMIFRGNPGTGKTTMGRMMASLMNKLGVIPEPSLKVLTLSFGQLFCVFVMIGTDQLESQNHYCHYLYPVSRHTLLFTESA